MWFLVIVAVALVFATFEHWEKNSHERRKRELERQRWALERVQLDRKVEEATAELRRRSSWPPPAPGARRGGDRPPADRI